MSTQLLDLTAKVQESASWIGLLRNTLETVVIGQKELLDRLIMALLVNGHVLLEGVPGLAKTLSIKSLAKAIQADFKRIQFTPDLLPADILGTLIYSPHKGEFSTKKGPIFANFVLADEINRAPAKAQSALLEAMQERQVTLGDTTYALPEPFLVLATENPIDQEGTYPLPEAQVDRFMLKVKISYPHKEEEKLILNRMAHTQADTHIEPVIALKQILDARKLLNSIYIDEKIKDYIIDIIFATRKPKAYGLSIENLIQYGASPRATIALTLLSKAQAFLQGRAYVSPQDVKSIALDALRHRVIVSYEAEAENIKSEDLILKILNTLPVP